jgi:hypothetical protein
MVFERWKGEGCRLMVVCSWLLACHDRLMKGEDGYVNVLAYKLTHPQACPPTSLPAYKLTCLQAYLPTCVQAYLPTSLPAYKPTRLQAYPYAG